MQEFRKRLQKVKAVQFDGSPTAALEIAKFVAPVMSARLIQPIRAYRPTTDQTGFTTEFGESRLELEGVNTVNVEPETWVLRDERGELFYMLDHDFRREYQVDEGD